MSKTAEETNLASVGQDDSNSVLMLTLSAGGISSEKEVLVFDLADLVGNVGGYLGLFLGASLISLLDGTKGLFDKYLVKKRLNF